MNIEKKNGIYEFKSKLIDKNLYKPKKKNYFYWIDINRGFSIICLVLTHSGFAAHLSRLTYPNFYIFDLFHYLVIPIFIFLSGYAMAINYPQIDNYKVYLKKKLKYIVPNYLIWGFITVFFTFCWSYINNNQIGKLFNIKEILFLLINSFFLVITGVVNVIYFVFFIIQFYIIYPILLKIMNKFKKPQFFYFVSLLIIIFLIYFLERYFGIFNFTKFNFTIQFDSEHTFDVYPFCGIFFAPNSLIFLSVFILGMVCGKNKKILSTIKHNKLIIIFLLVIFSLYLFLGPCVNHLFSAPIVLVIVSFFYKMTLKSNTNINEKKNIKNNLKTNQNNLNLKIEFVKEKSKNVLWKLGINSAGIYYVHSLFAPIIQITTFFIGNLTGYLLPILVLTSIGLTILLLVLSNLLVNFIKKKVDRSRYIIGS